MPYLLIPTRKLLVLSYSTCAVLMAIALFIWKEVSLGLFIGTTAGIVYALIFDKQMEFFVKNKRLHWIILSYIMRFFFLGFIFYFSIKQSTFLFAGTIVGFFLTQLIFIGIRLKYTD